MDQTLVTHYAQKFAACDQEELGDLVARRADLSDEAAAGLNKALSEKGLREVDVYTPPPAPALLSEKELAERLASDTQQARELWRGGLTMASKVMMGLVFMTPVQALLQRTRVGALWVDLLLLEQVTQATGLAEKLPRVSVPTERRALKQRERPSGRFSWRSFSASLWSMSFHPHCLVVHSRSNRVSASSRPARQPGVKARSIEVHSHESWIRSLQTEVPQEPLRIQAEEARHDAAVGRCGGVFQGNGR